MQEKLYQLLEKAVKDRIKNEKIGVLFSGGIDSTIIAFILKKLNINFTCYTAAVDLDAEDLMWSKKVAKELGFKLKICNINLDQAEKIIKKTAQILGEIERPVVHVGVGSVMLTVTQQAKKDNVKYLFSGLGSEEIFAGYQRHELSKDINQECKKGLELMQQGDLKRDNLIAKHEKLTFLTPFLDKELVDFALTIPGKEKIKDNIKKYILRQVALNIGIPKDIAFRKKRAAQYGSRFDKAIEKLAKQNGFKFKKDYLEQLNLKLAALISSGKDSIYAMSKMINQVVCLISIKSKNPDSYMYHTPNINLVQLQAQAIGIPLLEQDTKGEKEKELDDLKKALEKAKKQFNIQGVITGALYSNYQRERIEKVCESLNLKVFSPLWHMNQETEMREIVDKGFEVIISSIAAEGLDENDVGTTINHDFINKMVKLNKKNKINIAGEGGEFESLVLNAPFFKKRINILEAEKIMENNCTGKYLIKKAELI